MEVLIINKNRGWRGLAEAVHYNKSTGDVIHKQIFSFSQDMWDDMIYRHKLVIQTNDKYIIYEFADTCDALPKPIQQRSVLIKNVNLKILNITAYDKTTWDDVTDVDDHIVIRNFIMNRNNHTQSDWNCIGIRVIPSI